MTPLLCAVTRLAALTNQSVALERLVKIVLHQILATTVYAPTATLVTLLPTPQPCVRIT